MQIFKRRKRIKEIEAKLRTEITREVKDLYAAQLKEINDYSIKQNNDQKLYYSEKYDEQVEKLRKDQRAEIDSQEKIFKNEITAIKEKHKEAIKELDTEYNNQIKSIQDEHAKQIATLQDGIQTKIEEYESRETDYKKSIRNTQKAWNKILTIHPQIMALISLLRSQSELRTIEAERDQMKYSSMLNEAEIIDRKLEKMEPIMERLLNLDTKYNKNKTMELELQTIEEELTE